MSEYSRARQFVADAEFRLDDAARAIGELRAYMSSYGRLEWGNASVSAPVALAAIGQAIQQCQFLRTDITEAQNSE
jgi:hypothetical protein